jgi:hypothetical protein
MVYSDQIPRKEVAWNGIRFLSPREWELGKIGSRYLMLEDESGPVMEIKWGQIKGTFSHSAHLKRLSDFRGKGLGKSVSESPLPFGWEKALGSFESTGFSWRGTFLSGMGVILFCPTCRNATLIQFYQRDSGKLKRIYQPVLASFRDHRQDNQVVWSFFDIRAMMPGQYQLVRHRLDPGQFELVFESKGQQITLYRWGPASILLENRDLVEFAGAMVDTFGNEPHLVTQSNGKVVEWEVHPPLSRWKRLWGYIKTRRPFQEYRLWHIEEKNRILGVSAVGKKPFDTRLLEKIFSNYESI